SGWTCFNDTLTIVRYGGRDDAARAGLSRVRAVWGAGRDDRLDARRLPGQADQVHRDARQLRADGGAAGAGVDPARADTAAEARADGEGAGRGRPLTADLPRRRGPGQAAGAVP